MGRRKTVAELKEALAEAERRETARRNRRVEANRPYRARGTTTNVFYRSMLREQGNKAIFSTSVDANTLGGTGAILTATDAGLLTTLTQESGILVGSLRGSGTKPTKISWYYGNATPEVEFTPWQTRWIRFYDVSNAGQSHSRTPFSGATGDITSQNLKCWRSLALGEKGKATLTFENAAIRA